MPARWKFLLLIWLGLTTTSSLRGEPRCTRELEALHEKRMDMHMVSTLAYFFYTSATIPANIVSDVLREGGLHNFYTLHGTNLFQGIGFIGLTHNLLSAIEPRARTHFLAGTLAAFTLCNAGYEIFGQWSHPDWADFSAGQAGALGYVFVQKAVEWGWDWRVRLAARRRHLPPDEQPR